MILLILDKLEWKQTVSGGNLTTMEQQAMVEGQLMLMQVMHAYQSEIAYREEELKVLGVRMSRPAGMQPNLRKAILYFLRSNRFPINSSMFLL
ncbi:hypothetical protein Ocin01_15048 [Orchesella cincta]|uniref:Uncharacterized protein n=1 Tax=Orchesella cincta TaxID=48709 RepID=A0A1D2MFG1_ORCCI|nr:hypothetical protein Ocin01_15048 [Orchesella cincta]